MALPMIPTPGMPGLKDKQQELEDMVAPPTMAPLEMAGDGGSGGGVVINTGNVPPEERVTQSQSTTRAVQSDETRAATAELGTAQAVERAAVEKQMAEQAKAELEAAKAEAERIKNERAVEDEVRRQTAWAEHQRAEAEQQAAAAEAKAEEEVAKAQNSAVNWDSRGTGMKILHALLRAGSTKDALLTGRDPSQTPTARAIDSALADEKEKKKQKFLATKEWRDALKSKNAETIRRTYDREMARIGLEANTWAKNLLLDERMNTVASKQRANDPNGDLFKARRDEALAHLEAKAAADKQAFMANYDPKSTTGTEVETNKMGSAGKPPPIANREDTNEATAMEADIRELDRLEENIVKNPKTFEHVQERRDYWQRGQVKKDIVGSTGAPAIAVADMFTGGRYSAPSPAALLDTKGHPVAPDVNTGLENVNAIKARTYGGVIQQGDRDTAEKAAGESTRSVADYIRYIRILKQQRQNALEKLRRVRSGL